MPDLPPTLVQAPRISQSLETGVLSPVTLLSAPAGWGKSVALASWLSSDRGGQPVGWLTLEAGDDGTRFWSKLDSVLAATAIQEVTTRATTQTSGPEAIVERLYGLTAPIRLVLDDFHVVQDPDVMAGIDFLMRHGAGRLRLIISTRSDPDLPLHRWRLRGELTEIRADELAFTLDEAGRLLARHDIEIPATELRSLHGRTEGWPGGLQLAALAMRGHADAARIAANINGEDTTIAQYLEAEVLANLPPPTQDLLLSASVVDRFCADLADALAGCEDAEQQIADLRRIDAFLIPIECRPAWYRFHHLFGEMLRAKVRRIPGRSRRLHERAAAWHASHGLTVKALRHALAADDPPLADTLLRQSWPDLALCGLHDRSRTTPSLPSIGVLWSNADELTLTYAAEWLDAHDVDSADRALRSLSRRCGIREEKSRRSVELAIGALRLARARIAGDCTAVASAARALLDLVDAADPDDDGDGHTQYIGARAIALTALGTARLGLGDVESAGDAFAAVEAAGGGPHCPRVVCTGGLALVQALRGHLQQAQRSAQSALELGPCPGQNSCLHGEPAYLALALTHHEWNRPVDAAGFLDLARCSRELSGDRTLDGWRVLIGSWVRQGTGNLTDAHASLLEGRRTLPAVPSPHMARWFAATEAELRIACGEAHDVAATLTPLLDDVQAISTPVAVALAHAHLRDGDVRAAARVLPQWWDDKKAEPFLAFRLEAGLVEAVTAHRLGDARRSATTLERVLQLAEPEGFRRVFVNGGQQVRQLLAEQLEFGTAHWSFVRDLVDTPKVLVPQTDPSPAGPEEGLTDRELTVLRYMQSVLSNEEIASKLFVSVNTVKTHVRNIYRKLDVARRRDAVRRARELHLV